MPINELSEVEELRRELREALEARTSELSEALQEQRGTAEILRRMSNSPSNAQPVFDAILESAVRLCDPAKSPKQVAAQSMFRPSAK